MISYAETFELEICRQHGGVQGYTGPYGHDAQESTYPVLQRATTFDLPYPPALLLRFAWQRKDESEDRRASTSVIAEL